MTRLKTLSLVPVFVLTLVLACLAPSFGQKESDLQARIDLIASLSNDALPPWRILDQDIPEGAEPGLDDTSWTLLRRWPRASTKVFWLRQRLEVSQALAGVKTENSSLDLVCDFGGVGLFRGRFYVNGQERKSFDLDLDNERTQAQAVFPLAAAVHSGQSYVLAFRFENLGKEPVIDHKEAEPGTYLQVFSRTKFAGAEEAVARLGRLVVDLKTGAALLALGPEPELPARLVRPTSPAYQKLIASPNFQKLQETFARAVMDFDVRSLEAGDTPTVDKEIARFYERVKPVSDFAADRAVSVAGNAHIDLAWLWRWAETVQVTRATFDTVMKNMDEYPELIYLQSQAQAYKWMQDKYPDIFERIKQKVKEGRWEIVGGMWVEPDCNLIDGESFVRQMLYGKRYFQANFGKDVKIGWNPDSFGYNWNMPQLLTKAGFTSFVTQKISWNETNVFPHFFFWWEGPDGSRLLTYFPPTGYVGDLSSDELTEGVRLFERNTGLKNPFVLYGLGDHGGGPNRAMLDRARELARQKIFPRIEPSTMARYLGKFRPETLKSLPVWDDELYLEYHRGTYTTQAETKNNNRKSEVLMANVEKLSSLAMLYGQPYGQAELESAWEKVLLCQFHDTLPGSSINPVYRDAAEVYRQVRREAGGTLRRSLQAVGDKIDTASGAPGRPLLVFNTLSWNRDGVVATELPRGWTGDARVVDDQGREVPSQVLAEEGDLVFQARNVPAGGYRVYKLQNEKPSGAPSSLRATSSTLENEFLRVRLDPVSGDIVSLYDKVNGREVMAEGARGNALQLFEDIPEDYDAWNIGYTGRRWEINKADSVELLSAGPVKAVLRVKKSFLGLSKARRQPASDFPSSFFTQDIVLWEGIPRLDVEMSADWWEDHVLLKAAFPVSVQNDKATFEIPYASVQRPTGRTTDWDKARFEVPAIRWADLSDDGYGVSLINENKYGYDVTGNVLRLTLLRSPTDPDPMADKGKHRFGYSLYPHKGGWREAATVRKGYEFNYPLLTRFVEAHAGELPSAFSFFKAEPSDIVLSAIKKAEDRDSLVLRLYEAEGRATEARLSFFRPPKEVYALDLMEERLGPLPFKPGAGEIALKFGKSEIKSIELVF
jgi:alpha-mannosidase